ncbi:MAG: hypothetical protein Q8M26_08760 [Pseudolabrys sp.]|nr:hypothetical protein [Pseudolabrys sp.]
MRETWYVLEDGSVADPRDVNADEKGILQHKDGRAVAYRPDGITPRSRGVDVASKPLFGGKGDHDGDGRPGGAAPAADKAKDMKPEQPKRGYRTRETKAD